VANSTGSTTSSLANLDGLGSASDHEPAADQAVSAGQTASFPQWRAGTARLKLSVEVQRHGFARRDKLVLTLTNVHAAGAGSYSVVVTNVAGSVTSAGANLIVTTKHCVIGIRWRGDHPSGSPSSFSSASGITLHYSRFDQLPGLGTKSPKT